MTPQELQACLTRMNAFRGVNPASKESAVRFLETCKDILPEPWVFGDDDGDIQFEWEQERVNVTVTFSAKEDRP